MKAGVQEGDRIVKVSVMACAAMPCCCVWS